jgi:hypothetical protein
LLATRGCGGRVKSPLWDVGTGASGDAALGFGFLLRFGFVGKPPVEKTLVGDVELVRDIEPEVALWAGETSRGVGAGGLRTGAGGGEGLRVSCGFSTTFFFGGTRFFLSLVTGVGASFAPLSEIFAALCIGRSITLRSLLAAAFAGGDLCTGVRAQGEE